MAALCDGVVTSYASSEAANRAYVLGSVTKGIVATAAFALEEDGRFRLSDPAVRYIPELESRNDISLFDLLTHRSALPDFTRLLEAEPTLKFDDPHSALAMAAAFPDLSAVRGREQQYSSTDYVAMGIAIANASHESFSSYVEWRVAARAGVRFRFASDPDAGDVVDLPDGLLAQLSAATATGGIIATASDVATFDRELLHRRIIGKASLERMFTVRAGANDRMTPGWFSSSLNGYSALWHDGAYGPFRSANIVMPRQNIALVALSRNSATAPLLLMLDVLRDASARSE